MGKWEGGDWLVVGGFNKTQRLFFLKEMFSRFEFIAFLLVFKIVESLQCILNGLRHMKRHIQININSIVPGVD